jgi:serine/threonine protein kinase
MLLDARGIGVARPLVLIRKKFLGIARTEWIVMEVIPGALELDRHILTRVNASWSTEERRSLVRSFGRFIGSMHGKGIFHSDLKTCNILVSDERRQRGEQPSGGPHPLVRFSLVDYDDVSFDRYVSERKKIKNLVQIFLSTPLAIGTTDRLRFLSECALHAGMDRQHRREISRHVLEAARGRNILYVGFQGDVIEQWE